MAANKSDSNTTIVGETENNGKHRVCKCSAFSPLFFGY
jgi:hypothetical protein